MRWGQEWAAMNSCYWSVNFGDQMIYRNPTEERAEEMPILAAASYPRLRPTASDR